MVADGYRLAFIENRRDGSAAEGVGWSQQDGVDEFAQHPVACRQHVSRGEQGGIVAQSLITIRAAATTHLNSPRQVALFRSHDSQFADAIADFVAELGLGITVIVAADHVGSPESITEVADAAERCGAAIFALESKVIQDELASASSGRTAQPTPGTLLLLAHALASFPEKRLIIARQRDDPGRWDIPSVQTCNLGNDRGSAKQLVQALQNANTAIAAGRLKPTRSSSSSPPSGGSETLAMTAKAVFRPSPSFSSTRCSIAR
jgi:hypothetical protein